MYQGEGEGRGGAGSTRIIPKNTIFSASLKEVIERVSNIMTTATPTDRPIREGTQDQKNLVKIISKDRKPVSFFSCNTCFSTVSPFLKTCFRGTKVGDMLYEIWLHVSSIRCKRYIQCFVQMESNDKYDFILGAHFQFDIRNSFQNYLYSENTQWHRSTITFLVIHKSWSDYFHCGSHESWSTQVSFKRRQTLTGGCHHLKRFSFQTFFWHEQRRPQMTYIVQSDSDEVIFPHW